ncbi:hypothetical protein CH267_14855 [Rhodococcus sp. 06-621-2]|nr:hypothetical protein [Rhodococcus sp. 06-621-2]OZC55820.1 hypothetical protein CH267_14855 [Rhodococcus sp. 06-621-2]
MPPVDGDTPTTLPDIVINNIPATAGDGFWDGLTQPQATVFAGVLAVVAAIFAFGGVYYSQFVLRRTTKATLRVQSMAGVRQQRQHEAQLTASAALERAKHRREVEYAALSAAMTSTLLARDSVIALRGNIRDDDIIGRDPQEDAAAEARHPELLHAAQLAIDDAVSKAAALLMIGTDDAYKALMKLTAVSRRATIDIMPFSVHEFAQASVEAIDAIRKAYKP